MEGAWRAVTATLKHQHPLALRGARLGVQRAWASKMGGLSGLLSSNLKRKAMLAAQQRAAAPSLDTAPATAAKAPTASAPKKIKAKAAVKGKPKPKATKEEIAAKRRATIDSRAERATISGNERRKAYQELLQVVDDEEETYNGGSTAARSPPSSVRSLDSFGPLTQEGGFVVDPWAVMEQRAAGQSADLEGVAALPPEVTAMMKPHQLEGLRFLWKNVVVVERRYRQRQGQQQQQQQRSPPPIDRVPDSGCIIAHPMGLGKTVLSVVFLEVLLKAKIARTALVLAPKSTMYNWQVDSAAWGPRVAGETEAPATKLYSIPDDTKLAARVDIVENWHKTGGILYLGYDQYRTILEAKRWTGGEDDPALAKMHDTLISCLRSPGPDVLMCDEGHLLRNDDTLLWKTLMEIKTKRRVALTGTPLQNHLLEYWTMIEFLRPGFFPKKPFQDYFRSPIELGQRRTSTEEEIQKMKERAYILAREVAPFVQRQDHRILRDALPNKAEYVVYCPLSPTQKRIYNAVCQAYTRSPAAFHGTDRRAKSGDPSILFFIATMAKLVAHPALLADFLRKRAGVDVKKPEDAVAAEQLTPRQAARREFLRGMADWVCNEMAQRGGAPTAPPVFQDVDDDAEDAVLGATGDHEAATVEETEPPEVDINDGDAADPAVLAAVAPPVTVHETYDEVLHRNGISPKLIALLDIVEACMARGEKLLVFSQYVNTLTLLHREVRAAIAAKAREDRGSAIAAAPTWWLDGSLTTADRARAIRTFQAHTGFGVFFISTKAGGMGINLNTAHKAVLFDVSMNPSVDQQALFRLYRYGLAHEVEVYRLVGTGTPEAKVFLSCISKDWLAKKVVDDGAPSRANVHGVGLSNIMGDAADAMSRAEVDPSSDLSRKLRDETRRCIAASPTLERLSARMSDHGTPLQKVLRYESLLCDDSAEQAGAKEQNAYTHYRRTGRSPQMSSLRKATSTFARAAAQSAVGL